MMRFNRQLPASASTWGGAHLTTFVCFLAFVAVGNVVGGGARIALGGHHLNPLPFVINLVASVLLSGWALVRVRTQWCQDADAEPENMLDETEDSNTVQLPPRPSARRRAIHATIALAFTAVAAVTIVSQWGTLQVAFGQLGHVHWRTLRWALYAEVLALIAFAQLTRLLLRAGGVNFGLGSMFRLTLASNAMALTLPGGPAWAVTFSIDQLRRRGVRKSLGAYAFVLTWLMSAIALIVIAVIGVDVAGDAGASSRFRGVAMSLTAIVALAAIACLLLIRLPRLRATAARIVRRSCANAWWWRRIERPILTARQRLTVRVPGPVLLRCIAAALLNWIYDCAALVLSIVAVGGHVPWQGVLAAYALTQLAAALPITPGGVGVVEGTLSIMLIACHMPAATAIAAVMLYRIISFWLLVPIGWGAFLSLLGKPRRHSLSLAARYPVARVGA